MAKDSLSGTLAVILHADVAGSTVLVQRDKQLAHDRIQDAFRRFGNAIEKYQGHVLEKRGDALLAEFMHASDAVTAALAFQSEHTDYIAELNDDIQPVVRVGIAMGEVIIADGTVTGAGVVQAQRIEQIADSGGVCITAAIHEALSKFMPFDFESLGEKTLKGFDYSMRVYRVELKPGESIPPPAEISQANAHAKTRRWIAPVAVIVLIVAGGAAHWFISRLSLEEAASTAHIAFPSPGKSSLAILPFTNLGDDSQQAYFADGITDDLITDISKISGLLVIARNSVFTYKDKTVDVRQVANELGVRYVMEGSVRRAGNQIRVNAQLIDATTGGHVWAERYDGSLDDVFSMQDEITRKIVTALAVTLSDQEQSSLFQAETKNPEAYDAFLQGWTYYIRRTPGDYQEASRHFRRAIELDPDYGRTYAALASTYWEVWERKWHKHLGFEEPIGARQQAEQYLEAALKNPTALAHQVASEVRRQEGRHSDMVREAETAVRLDPNDPNSYLALTWALVFVGKAEDALAAIDRAMILDPHYPAFYLYTKGFVYFMLRKYEYAGKFLERALERNPANFPARNILIPTYAYLGRIDSAKEQIALYPLPLSIDILKFYYPFKHSEDWAHMAEGLRQAGVPEVAAKPFSPQ